ncbi:MAG: 2-hydroxyacid dehydrogenase [Paludibacter sp.]
MKIFVSFPTYPQQREFLNHYFETETEIIFSEDYPQETKNSQILNSDIVFTTNPEKEGLYDPSISFENVKFIQLFTSGYDHVKLDQFPANVQIASNQGAYAEPMAEHAVAMILALSKRLTVYHNQMAEGQFRQLESMTKSINGSTFGIIGFGSIGKATARLLRPFGVKTIAINTSGKTNEDIAFIGTLNDVDYVLKNSDILLISCPLNDDTKELISKQKLELMKEDAILINLARGAVINQKDLFEHLKNHPDFYAGLDVWWVEPFMKGKFEINYPFFDLPNLLGSPHNSAMVENSLTIGTEKAAANIKRFMLHESVVGLVHANV